jgi:hypothetical protein
MTQQALPFLEQLIPSFLTGSKRLKLCMADPEDDERFKAGIRNYLSSAKTQPLPDDIEKTVDCIHRESYAVSLQSLTTNREEELRLAHESCEKAKRLEDKILGGKIQEICPEQTWMLPKGFWSKVAFTFVLGAAVLTPPCEVINLAWYIRFDTQSFLTAFLYCSSIVIFPIAEVVVLRRLVRSDKAKKTILLIQTLAACASGIVYVGLTLRHGDTSLSAMFSGQKMALSNDTMRMAAQILTSILLSGVCLHTAIEMGRRENPENEAFRHAQESVENLRKDAGEHFQIVSRISGELERIQIRKPEAILFCRRQFARIEAEYDRHNQTLEKLFNEPMSI